MTTTITTTATAVPPHVIVQSEVAAMLGELFGLEPSRQALARGLFENSAVDRRYSVLPLAEVGQRRSITRTAALYHHHATDLARRAGADALAKAGLSPRDVDLLVTVSCTGFTIPAIDVQLVHDLGLRPDVRRLPITELGCLGGAAALALAGEFVRARPGAVALVIAVELCTLNLQRDDLSPQNLVSTALFGDGAGAAVVQGREAEGARIVAARSHIIPGSQEAMGFELRDDGFHMRLSRVVPDLLSAHLHAPVHELLRAGDVERDDLAFFVIHPGGRRILERVEETLGLTRDHTEPSWSVLRGYGNLSSATVFFVLDEHIARRRPASGEHGLLAAFGPGVAAEMLLLQWS
ncbi:MAG: 3-oxoacyl-[acyl-carrier-protein] synthase III C-terminal domain-containing protein [Minicystis sp.]